MGALAARALEPGFLEGCTGQPRANLAWAYATLGLADGPLGRALGLAPTPPPPLPPAAPSPPPAA